MTHSAPRKTAAVATSRTAVALEEARILEAHHITDGHFDTAWKRDAYLATFKSYGIDVTTLPIDDATNWIRSSPIADDLIAALDDWARSKSADVPVSRLDAIARAAETDPVRATIRDAIASRDVSVLRRLCATGEARRKLGPRLRTVFNSLARLDPAASVTLLEGILREHPSDFWFNHDLGLVYRNLKPPKIQEAIRCLSVSVALRPESPGIISISEMP